MDGMDDLPKFIGWTRSSLPQGRVLRHHLKPYSNCITQFAGLGGYRDKDTHMCNTTPYILLEYE